MLIFKILLYSDEYATGDSKNKNLTNILTIEDETEEGDTVEESELTFVDGEFKKRRNVNR